MTDDNAAIRLKGFIEHLGLSYSVFADECGVPRPSLSQILSGRNKKISDVLIRQIHQAFPELSISWLLFGEGNMLVGSPANIDASAGGDGQVSLGDSMGNAGMHHDDTINADMGSWLDEKGESIVNHGISRVNSPNISGDGSGTSKYENLRALNEARKALQDTKEQLDRANETIASLTAQIEKLVKNPRKVGHVTIYYDDSTFETFLPK
ncbi:MAG: helix-turn-helix domain-containing protein [Muribaculaceae bacterium]|nr:helix-turn-helix domain-containing protein [Muribaculaceae bacterium]